MLVTALNPWIGYDSAVTIGELALAETVTLKLGGGTLRLRAARGFRSLGRAVGDDGAGCHAAGRGT
jgi:fumarate hydratase class II